MQFSSSNQLTTLEAAAYCRISKPYLEKMRVYGTGPVFVKLGRRVVYRLLDLDEWLSARVRRSTSGSAMNVAAGPADADRSW